jgi:hypothetical protein
MTEPSLVTARILRLLAKAISSSTLIDFPNEALCRTDKPDPTRRKFLNDTELPQQANDKSEQLDPSLAEFLNETLEPKEINPNMDTLPPVFCSPKTLIPLPNLVALRIDSVLPNVA